MKFEVAKKSRNNFLGYVEQFDYFVNGNGYFVTRASSVRFMILRSFDRARARDEYLLQQTSDHVSVNPVGVNVTT